MIAPFYFLVITSFSFTSTSTITTPFAINRLSFCAVSSSSIFLSSNFRFTANSKKPSYHKFERWRRVWLIVPHLRVRELRFKCCTWVVTSINEGSINALSVLFSFTRFLFVIKVSGIHLRAALMICELARPQTGLLIKRVRNIKYKPLTQQQLMFGLMQSVIGKGVRKIVSNVARQRGQKNA